MADNFLKEIVTTENCLVNYYFAERFHCEELKAKSQEMINSNFSAVMGTDDFLNFSVKQVKEWVSSDHIIINAEEEVFQEIVRWVSHNKSEREGDFPELLDKVRISSLTHNFVLHELEREELVTENSLRASSPLGSRARFSGASGEASRERISRETPTESFLAG